MKAPDVLMTELMAKVRGALFQHLPLKSWHNQMEIVKRALTLPGAWLDERKVEVSAERYQAILEGILATILAHGRKNVGRRPSVYLYTCVERHMAHHGHEYYEEGKGIRNRVKLFMTDVDRIKAGADGTVPAMAKAHAVLDAGKRKAKVKAVAATLQRDLF